MIVIGEAHCHHAVGIGLERERDEGVEGEWSVSYVVDVDLLHFSTVLRTRFFDSLSQLIDEQRIGLKALIERGVLLDVRVSLL